MNKLRCDTRRATDGPKRKRRRRKRRRRPKGESKQNNVSSFLLLLFTPPGSFYTSFFFSGHACYFFFFRLPLIFHTQKREETFKRNCFLFLDAISFFLLPLDLIGQTRKAKSQNSCTHNYIRSTEVKSNSKRNETITNETDFIFYFIFKNSFPPEKQEKRKKEEIMCEIISISCSMTPSQPAPWARPFIPFPIHLVSGHYTVTGPRRTGGAGETHQSAGDFNRISIDPFEISTGGGGSEICTNKVAS
jgi:hypothetical protein